MKSIKLLLTLVCLAVGFPAAAVEVPDSAKCSPECTCAECDCAVETEKLAPLYRNIFVEIGGVSNVIGLAYDSRIRRGSPFGFRAGISFTSGDDNDFGIPTDHIDSAVTFPLAFNCILGRRASKFETALGFNPGAYSCTEVEWGSGGSHRRAASYRERHFTTFGYNCFADIGYRLQRRSGFFFRAGLNVDFSFGGNHSVSRDPHGWLYLGFGYTFK